MIVVSLARRHGPSRRRRPVGTKGDRIECIGRRANVKCTEEVEGERDLKKARAAYLVARAHDVVGSVRVDHGDDEALLDHGDGGEHRVLPATVVLWFAPRREELLHCLHGGKEWRR